MVPQLWTPPKPRIWKPSLRETLQCAPPWVGPMAAGSGSWGEVPSPAAPVILMPSPILGNATLLGPFLLAGSNLSNVTGVTVGGAAATSVSSTSIGVVFTPPATTASATPYTITVTTAFGTCVLPNAFYSLPTGFSHIFYTPVFASKGNPNGFGTVNNQWGDAVGSVDLQAIVSGMTAPTLTSSWANGQPAVTFSGTQALQSTSAPLTHAQPFSYFVVGTVTDTTNYDMFFATGSSSSQVYGTTTPGSALLSEYAGTQVQSTFSASSTPHLYEFFFNGASSFITQDNGAQSTFNPGADANGTGLTIGSQYDGNNTITSGVIGSVALLMYFNGAPSSGNRTLLHSVCQAIYGTP